MVAPAESSSCDQESCRAATGHHGRPEIRWGQADLLDADAEVQVREDQLGGGRVWPQNAAVGNDRDRPCPACRGRRGPAALPAGTITPSSRPHTEHDLLVTVMTPQRAGR